MGDAVPDSVICRLVKLLSSEKRYFGSYPRSHHLQCHRKVACALGITLKAVQRALKKSRTETEGFAKPLTESAYSYKTISCSTSQVEHSGSQIKDLILKTLQCLAADGHAVSLPNLQTRLEQQQFDLSRLALIQNLRSLGYRVVPRAISQHVGIKYKTRWRSKQKRINISSTHKMDDTSLPKHGSVFVDDDLIEIVKHYRCKLCQESFHSHQLASQHIKNTHIVDTSNAYISKVSPTCTNVGDHDSESADECTNAFTDVKVESSQYGTDMTSPGKEGPSGEKSPDIETLISNLENVSHEISGINVSTVKTESSSTGKENMEELQTPSKVDLEMCGEIHELSEATMKSIGNSYKVAKGKLTGIGTGDQEFVCGTCKKVFPTIEKCISHLTNVHEPQKDGQYVASVKERSNGEENNLEHAKDLQEEQTLGDVAGQDLSENPTSEGGVKKLKTEMGAVVTKKSTFRTKLRGGRAKVRDGLAKSFVCHCSASFTSQENLSFHKLCHVATPPANSKLKYSCPKCQKMFETWTQLRHHLWRTHNIGLDLLQCMLCAYRTDNKSCFDDHLRTHGTARDYVCEMCSKSFRQKHALWKHQKTHFQPQSHTCTRCNTGFSSKQTLRTHIMAVHERLRPHLCPFCAHTTTRKESLDMHIRTHTNEKPFRCTKCDFCCRDRNSLRRHMRRHEKDKPYLCQFCTYSCIQSNQLKTHMHIHHPNQGGLYTCDFCSYRTINQNYFNTHIQSHKDKSGLTFIDAECPQPKVPAAQRRSSASRKKTLKTEEKLQVLAIEESEQEPVYLVQSDHQSIKQEMAAEEVSIVMPSHSQVSNLIIPENVPHDHTVEVVSEGEHIICSENMEHNIQLVEISNGDTTTQVQLPVTGNIDPVQLLFSALSALQ